MSSLDRMNETQWSRPHARPGLDDALMSASTSSFVDLLHAVHPELLATAGVGTDGVQPTRATTIVAVKYRDGVVMAGDRRATRGHEIAQRDIEKVFAADEATLIGVAGAAGMAIHLARLYRLELSHYEKLEGASLSFEGKANRLATMIREQLTMALQGFVVVPLLAGWDPHRREGRVVSYDATGGHYEESEFASIGSGSAFARGSLKKLHHPDLERDEAALVCIQALFDAADDDSATGGPDLIRAIYPVVMSASEQGVHGFSDDAVAGLTNTMMSGRHGRPNGPGAASS
ncbi:Proteasome subunit beta [Propionibacterium freudenreichii]|nr:Proteasome subunit beta [Propionibacterium freudenreichii]SCQ68713.1 Proteasome subunit beta [Propionibacterium freudenreichii]